MALCFLFVIFYNNNHDHYNREKKISLFMIAYYANTCAFMYLYACIQYNNKNKRIHFLDQLFKIFSRFVFKFQIYHLWIKNK